jgi:hypothetical protein
MQSQEKLFEKKKKNHKKNYVKFLFPSIYGQADWKPNEQVKREKAINWLLSHFLCFFIYIDWLQEFLHS